MTPSAGSKLVGTQSFRTSLSTFEKNPDCRYFRFHWHLDVCVSPFDQLSVLCALVAHTPTTLNSQGAILNWPRCLLVLTPPWALCSSFPNLVLLYAFLCFFFLFFSLSCDLMDELFFEAVFGLDPGPLHEGVIQPSTPQPHSNNNEA